MTWATTTVDTPDGPFTLLSDGQALRASGWAGDCAALMTGLRDTVELPTAVVSDPSAPLLQEAAAAVAAYYAGQADALTRIPVAVEGSEFARHSGQVLRRVAYGERISYAELARRAGRPGAHRAVARVCSHNRTALFVPCHRVVRSDGRSGEFLYGAALKRALLEREAGGGEY